MKFFLYSPCSHERERRIRGDAAPHRREAWTFDMAIVALEKRLRAMRLWEEEEPHPAIRGARQAE